MRNASDYFFWMVQRQHARFTAGIIMQFRLPVAVSSEVKQ